MKTLALLFAIITISASAQEPIDLRLDRAGAHLEKSATASTLALVTGVVGSALVVAVAGQDGEAESIIAMGGLTAIGTLSFSISAISHKRKAGKALRVKATQP
jgi:hypothetical protein